MKRFVSIVLVFLTLLYFIQTFAYYEYDRRALGLFLSEMRAPFVISVMGALIMLLLPFSFSQKLARMLFCVIYFVMLFKLNVTMAHELDKVTLGQHELALIHKAGDTKNREVLKRPHYTSDRYGDYAYYLNYAKKRLSDQLDEEDSLQTFTKKLEKLKFLSSEHAGQKGLLQYCQKKLKKYKQSLLHLYRKTYNRAENAYFILKSERPTNWFIFNGVLDDAAAELDREYDYYTESYQIRYEKLEAAEKIVDYLLMHFGDFTVENDTITFADPSMNDAFTSLVRDYRSYDDQQPAAEGAGGG